MRKLLTLVSFITLFQLEAQAGFCFNWFGFGKKAETVSDSSAPQVAEYKSIISILKRKTPREANIGFGEKWSCDYGSCIPLSAQMFTALKTMQMTVERVEVNSLFKIGGLDLPSGAFHFFLVDRTNPNAEIIIDPTYLQFFKGPIPEPDIFIGTRAQLEALFLKHRAYIKPQNADDARRSLDPIGVVEVFYGYGRGEQTTRKEPSRIIHGS